jgi:hypothetical protein
VGVEEVRGPSSGESWTRARVTAKGAHTVDLSVGAEERALHPICEERATERTVPAVCRDGSSSPACATPALRPCCAALCCAVLYCTVLYCAVTALQYRERALWTRAQGDHEAAGLHSLCTTGGLAWIRVLCANAGRDTNPQGSGDLLFCRRQVPLQRS